MNPILKVAGMLDGIEYSIIPKPGRWTRAVYAAEQDGLVILFGRADDVLEATGAIHDEMWVSEAGKFLFGHAGFVKDWRDFIDDWPSEEAVKDYLNHKNNAREVLAHYHRHGDEHGFSWTLDLGNIPHATFRIFEDGEPFSLGVIFRLSDLCRLPDPIPPEIGRGPLAEATAGDGPTVEIPRLKMNGGC